MEQANLRYGCAALFSTPSILGERFYTTLEDNSDDEQEIFDTINSLGVRLTTGELLKNYIFSAPTIRPLYDTLWEPVFEEDEKQVLFWNKEKTSGRIIRTNIEVLLYCYLVINNKAVVELEKLFKEYKKWLQGKTHQEQINFLEELKDYAAIYYKFPQGTELNEIEFSQDEERFFHVIESYEITTVYPLVLYIYKRVVDANLRLQLLSILESYLVRRNVCHLTTKNYNNLFIQIIGKLDQSQSITVDSLKAVLTNFAEDTNKYPTDAEFKAAFHDEPISNANAREILYCISLFQIAGPKSDIRKLSSNNYSTEHMMPQKWQANWSVSGMDEAGKVKRDKTIKTLGNLTLVTKNLNSSMKNAKWDRKREVLKQYSHLQITTEYISSPNWDETRIGKRAEDLASAALKIWKWPW